MTYSDKDGILKLAPLGQTKSITSNPFAFSRTKLFEFFNQGKCYAKPEQNDGNFILDWIGLPIVGTSPAGKVDNFDERRSLLRSKFLGFNPSSQNRLGSK